MGLARISLNLGGERTVLPNIGSYHFTLDFIATGKTTVERTLTGFGTVVEVPLEPATWTLEVKGYTDSSHTEPTDIKLTGSMSIPIAADTLQSFDVYLTPNLGSGERGSLEYTINLSALPNTGIRAWFGLYPLEVVGTKDYPAISHEYDISTSAGIAAVPVTLDDLPAGTYRAVVDLYDSTDNKAAVRTEVVHIYANLPTSLTYSFASTDFAECPPKIDGTTPLAGKLDAALESASGAYTIVLGDDETFIPKTLNVTGDKNISITIRGNGKEVQVSTTGTPLLTLQAATINDKLTLELRDITLRGSSGNTVPVVRVEARGTLAMKPGSLITGNTSSSGVYVDSSGTFNLSGGAVSGNTGRGVYVYNNTPNTTITFTMSGGAVSDNTSSSGGGVYIGSGGGAAVFNLSGGAVSDNTSSSSGGGVYIGGVGSLARVAFNMSGGAVSGNTSSSGGGVYVTGNMSETLFDLSGGAVSGNTSSSGGGVYVASGGTLSMSGGAVRDNILSNDANSLGREVLVSGTFKLSGDAMPERVFLYNNNRFITISGPLSGGPIPIDLGVTNDSGTNSLTGYENKQILKKDATAYPDGDLAELKGHFSLGDAKRTNSSAAGTGITGYKIDDDGKLVTAP
jgi:hypothetical protein